MANYIVNHSIKGFSRREITDTELKSGDGGVVVVVLDKSTSDQLYNYYNRILDLVLSKNKIILIMLGVESNIRKTICTLMCSYRCYDIYSVDSLDIVGAEYIENLMTRESSYEEVQTFVGADITAYSDINTIFLGIENLVSEGNTEGLKVFLEQHTSSVCNLTEVLDYMRRVVDSVNSGEMQTKINDLKQVVERAKEELEEKYKKSRDEEAEKRQIQEDLMSSQKELAKTLAKMEELQVQVTSKAPVIKTYNEINTALIKCKAKIIIYFKEVSQIPYINSLVLALLESIKIRKIRAKLVIYDNKSGLSSVYKPLNVIGSSEYMGKRESFSGKTEMFVVVEPNPIILDDILTFNASAYDVVIIYDRMKQTNDIVTGNNVHKFFVINSSKDFKEVQRDLKITDKSTIITRSDSGIGNEVLDIPKIEGYSVATKTAQISKYMKVTTAISKKPLVSTILDRVRLGTLTN